MTAVEIPNPYPELWALPGSVQGSAHLAQAAVASWQDDIAENLAFFAFLRGLRATVLGARVLEAGE